MTRFLAILPVLFAGLLWGQGITVSNTPVAALPQPDGPVNAIKEHNGKLYIGGEFANVGGVSRAYLAAIDLTTNQVTSWAPAINGSVMALALHGNNLYVGGSFTTASSQARQSFCSFDLSTGNLTGWNPATSLPANTTNIYFDDDVHVLETAGDTLYAGGGFTAIDGTPRGHLCSFDLTNLGAANGLTAWDPNVLVDTSGMTGSPPYFLVAGVQGLYVDPGSNLCVVTSPSIQGAGGSHLHDGSASPHSQLNHLMFVCDSTGTGAPKYNWTPAPNINFTNYCFGIGSKCFVSGELFSFTSGGVTSNRYYAAALDMTGDTGAVNVVQAWDPATDERVICWATDQAQNVLFMGGVFTTVQTNSAPRLCMVDATTGTPDLAWQPNPDAQVRKLLFSGSRIYAGGEFTQISGAARMYLAAYAVTTSVSISTQNPLPAAVSGQAYAQQFAASGGTSPYTWGAQYLPGGWSMSASGLLTAANPAPGQFSFDVTVTDSAANAFTSTFDVTVSAALLTITTAAALPTGTQGLAYSVQLGATGGIAAYSWAVAAGSSLPAGWSIDPSTGVLSAPAGSVNQGNNTFEIEVTDTQPATASRVFYVTVTAIVPPLAITSGASLPGGSEGQAYSFQFMATGGQGAYSWSVQTGSTLPGGWSLDSGTGVLVGAGQNVAPGNFVFSIQVTDGTLIDGRSFNVMIATSAGSTGDGGSRDGGGCVVERVAGGWLLALLVPLAVYGARRRHGRRSS